MRLQDIRFPRQLEAEGIAETVRQALMAHMVKLWSGGDFDVPMITMVDPLKKVLQTARFRGQVRCGFEAISDKLASERKGIAGVRERMGASYGDRTSRLLLFSNDGAERFYRHIENLLQAHAPRLLGCRLDIDGSALGHLITGKDSRIKLVMIEHKAVVSEILRTVVAGCAVISPSGDEKHQQTDC
jgi:hypothetical protein